MTIDEVMAIVEKAMQNYERTPDGLYFPNLGGQEIPFDNERIAQYLGEIGLLEDWQKASDEEIEGLYNRYFDRIDDMILFDAICFFEIDVDMITEN